MDTANDLVEDLVRAKETAERLVVRYPNDLHFKAALGSIEDAMRQIIINDDDEDDETVDTLPLPDNTVPLPKSLGGWNPLDPFNTGG